MKRPASSEHQTRPHSNRVFAPTRTRTSRRPSRSSNAPPNPARKSSAPRNFSVRSISARARTTRISSSPKKSPAPAPTPSASSPRNTRLSSSPRCSRSAPPAFIITPPPSLMPTVRCSASTGRCTFPTIRFIYEKFYFTPGDLGFKAWQTQYAKNWRADLLGPMVSRSRAPDGHAGRGNSFLSRPPSAGIPAKRKNTGSNSMAPGKPSSAATPSRTAVTWPWPTASATKSSPAWAVKALNSGVRVSSPAPPAKSSPRPAPTEEEILIVPVDLAHVDTTRTHWPFLRDRRIDAYGNLTKRFVD